jgi:hypothetical protein
MTTWQKIFIGVLAAIIWAVAVYVGYTIPVLSAPMEQVKTTAYDVLMGVGLYHLVGAGKPSTSAPPDPPSQDVALTGSQDGH